MQIYQYPVVCYNRHFAVFFETSVLKEVHILYPLSLQQHDSATSTKSSK